MTNESITISPRLLSLGEPVTIHLTSEMEYVPLTLELTPRYLEQEFTVGEGIRVNWDETGPVKRGVAIFTPEETGNYVIRFGEIFRSFAVVDETYTVCTMSIPFSTGPYPRGNQLDFYHSDVHRRHIPADYVVLITEAKNLSPDWDVHKTLHAFHRIAGDAIVPYLDNRCASVLASKVASSISDMPEEEALAVLYHLKIAWKALGYHAPLIVHASLPGYGFERAASQEGVIGIGGLGGEDILGAQRLSENKSGKIPDNNRLRSNLTHGPSTYQNPPVGLSWQPSDDGQSGVLNPSMYQARGQDMPRLYQDLETFLTAGTSGDPRRLSVILDGDAFDVVEMNRALISHLIEKTREHHLVFALSEDVVRFLKA